jgi:acetyl-CoA carboxylase biotin carboxylase subunit
MEKIRKILVANRGEIALRVMRSAKEMGISTVAVYSDADRNAPFVNYADEAIHIGPPPSSESYLRIDKIIAAAKSSGAQAIHPGYGFLSENAVFASAVKEAGLIFIGPDEQAIETMGSKLAAKQAVKAYDIPMVPGTDHAIESITEAIDVAKRVGFPLLIKASAGGGGKGMRIVHKETELEEQMTRAISEAVSAFGDGSVFIERYISSPRHIEIQVLADKHGNTLYLFERECSIQRRHQKVVEEAPSAVLTPEIRKAMGEAAVKVAESCNYVGAGTVEFLVDDKLNFYFLEMNTRLQVEHPVTELITGVDLVKEQIKIAEGQPISFAQSDLEIRGHALEIRVYAEDPMNNFLPDIGTLSTYRKPEGPGIRVDDGFREGMTIPIFYDPMIAKLIVYGNNREEAIERMLRAIDDYRITGVSTTLPFCRFAVNHQAFRTGQFDTHFVANYFKPEYLTTQSTDLEEVATIAAAFCWEQNKISQSPNQTLNTLSTNNWVKNRKN